MGRVQQGEEGVVTRGTAPPARGDQLTSHGHYEHGCIICPVARQEPGKNNRHDVIGMSSGLFWLGPEDNSLRRDCNIKGGLKMLEREVTVWKDQEIKIRISYFTLGR